MKTLISFSCFFVFLFVCLFLKPRFGLVYNDKANVLSDETSDLKSHRCEWKPLTSWSPQQCQNFYYCYIRVVTKGEAQFLKLLRVKKKQTSRSSFPRFKKKKEKIGWKMHTCQDNGESSSCCVFLVCVASQVKLLYVAFSDFD